MVRVWIALWMVVAGAAHADTVSYDLLVRGLKVGVLQLAVEETPRQYSVAAKVTNTGLTQVIRRFSYTGSAQGRVLRSGLQPRRYVEKADTGRRVSEVELAYQNGVPRVVRYTSPREAGPDSPDPASQGGTVDPLTAVYAVLRDIPEARACQLRIVMFDGKRQSRISLQRAGERDGLPLCAGRYERLKGFTPDEVARHRTFDFSLAYQRGEPGELSVREIVASSIYGHAVIQRQ